MIKRGQEITNKTESLEASPVATQDKKNLIVMQHVSLIMVFRSNIIINNI